MLTQAELKTILSYNQDTGVFIRLISRNSRYKAGMVAGSPNNAGYYHIQVNGKLYKSHRLAWLYMTGSMPKEFIDHINGDKSDNRFCNLREATRAENNRNVTKRKNNKSGHKGVYWDNKECKWIAYARVDYKPYRIGAFDEINLAIKAHEDFIKPIHKEFYR